ncbi:hypothetical protein E3E12_02200 [Formicincola oecophyllae]|uniref:Uncharacterized protein n=1 Tax=Formicincola oecophyllae TaxID=2558361 RepID=A0A4Y6UAP7_9PROT|nr:hypothetical protein [Formicincola oecophyllae]QDH13205.1 hypothetical protein E3E12_02200 [Formicincola oecophyllae]
MAPDSKPTPPQPDSSHLAAEEARRMKAARNSTLLVIGLLGCVSMVLIYLPYLLQALKHS